MRWLAVTIIFATLLSACAPSLIRSAQTQAPAIGEPGTGEPERAVSEGESESSEMINRRVDDQTEYSYRQLLPLDAIRPVYDPEFVTADQSPLEDDELVIGIALEGETKAYPISVLRFREMVNDELAGMHILVSW